MPAIDPELVAILDAARTDLGHESYHYHAAADWCEERGDYAADGLRLMAQAGRRPRSLGANLGRWGWEVPTGDTSRSIQWWRVFEECAAHWVSGAQLRSLPPVGDTQFRMSEARYDTFAHAVYSLACVLAKEPVCA